MESKIWHKRTYLQNRSRLTDITKGDEGEGGMNADFGVGRFKQLHLEWMSNEVLLYSTRTYTQYLEIEHDGRQHKKEVVYIYIYIHHIYVRLVHYAVQQKLAQHCISTIH